MTDYVKGLQHPTLHDHSAEVDGIRIWTCSGCGTVRPWVDGWTSYSTIECHKKTGCGMPRGCGFAKVWWVACSEECMAKMPEEMSRGD